MKPSIWFGLAVALLASPAAHAEFCEKPSELRDSDTPYSLWGKCLTFSKITRSSRLPLDSIVYFPVKRPGTLRLSVDRSELTSQFIEDVFDRSNPAVLEGHHLAQRGISLSLTPKHLEITIFPSVIVRLRSDILADPNYRTFNGQPTFVVEEVSGDVYVATDLNRIASAFQDVYVQYVMRFTETSTRSLADGRTQASGSVSSHDALPPRQMPSKKTE